MINVNGENIRHTPKFNIGDRVRVYIDWVGYQTGIIISMNTDSCVYDWLYDIKLDKGQAREYTWNRCDLDIEKIKS